MHAYIYIYIYTYTHTYIHIYLPTYIYISTLLDLGVAILLWSISPHHHPFLAFSFLLISPLCEVTPVPNPSAGGHGHFSNFL